MMKEIPQAALDVKDQLQDPPSGLTLRMMSWRISLGKGRMKASGTRYHWHCLIQVRSEAHARTLPLKVLRLAEPRQKVPSYVPAR